MSVAARRLATALLTAVAVGCLGAAGCGGNDDEPQSSDVPDSAVAVVGDAEISDAALQEQVASLRRAQGGQGGHGPNGGNGKGSEGDGDESRAAARDQLERQALSMLVLAEALEQEAADRGVEVTDAEVRGRWEAASGRQFANERSKRRFLRGQTEQDVLSQLRLQLLTQRIHEDVAEHAGGGRPGQRAVRRFQRQFSERWRKRTACGEGRDAALCGG